MQINTSNILNNLQLNLAKISNPNKVDSKDSADEILDDNVKSEMDSTKAEIMNYNNAIGYMQIADGALAGISAQTQTLNKLNVAIHNDALNDEQKGMLKSQMQDIKKGIDETIANTTYNGVNVFNNSFRIGNEKVSLEIKSDSLDINNPDSIANFQKYINNTRNDIAAFTLNATEKSNELTAKFVNEANSKSQFEPDISKTINNIKKDNLELNASTMAMAHNTDLLAEQIKNLIG